MSSAPKPRSLLKPVLTLLALGLMCAVCMVPSLPGYFASQQRAKRFECHEGLRAVMQRFHERRDAGVSVDELRAAVPGDRRQPYTYVIAEGVTVAPEKEGPTEAERDRQLAKVRELVAPGLRGTCPDCSLTIACVANTDDDLELDVISVSSQLRYSFGDLEVDPGELYLQASDFPTDSEIVVRFEATDGGR